MNLAFALLVAAPPAPAVKVTDIRMHLFYEGTGRLSPDLTRPGNDFIGWNAIIGAGSAEEPANDLLVVAQLKTAGEKFVRTPLRIVVTNAKGKILASRQFRTFLIPKGGTASLPLWVQNAGCAGMIKATVQLGDQLKTETLALDCGE